MNHPTMRALAVLCVAGSVSCAQPVRENRPSADATPQAPAERQNQLPAARLDAKWSSALIGMPVANTNGVALGRVQEVIIDGYGRPGFAIVRYGGNFMGAGARFTAIPWETVAELLERDRLTVDQSILEQAPVLMNAGARDGDWRGDADRYWRGKVASAR